MEFSDLALAKLLQTSPELGSLIVNFIDLTDEAPPETGIQVGVFMLASGPETFYVPVITKASTILPIDSMVVNSTGKFLPLTRKVIDGLLNAGQLEKGKPAKIPKNVDQNPSLHNIINPPRTGKFSYASTSRLTDFLASMPDSLKTAVFEKIAAEKSVYDDLDKMFSLKALFDVLKPASGGPADEVNQVPISVVTAAGPKLDATQRLAILEKGYAVVGQQVSPRVAVAVQPAARDASVRTLTVGDGDKDYDLAFEDGSVREAFVPKRSALGSFNSKFLALFSNGDYATSQEGFITIGDPLDRKDLLKRLFENSPPILMRDTMIGDTIAIMDADGAFIGPISVNRVIHNNFGVDLMVSGGSGVDRISGYRNYAKFGDVIDRTLFLPYNSVVLKLNNNVSYDLARSVFQASNMREFRSLQLLGDELNIGFDGVEYSINGTAIGGEPSIMEALVVRENIQPDQAENFVKRAQVEKRIKVYLTKRASTSDFNPAEIPSYGAPAANDSDKVGPNGSFMPDIQAATKLGDGQTVEATVISHLLQVPDMFPEVEEYLPDLEEAVDRLGRTLFLSRLHIGALSDTMGPDAVFSLLAQTKAVYRMLGENVARLKQLSTLAIMSSPVEGDDV